MVVDVQGVGYDVFVGKTLIHQVGEVGQSVVIEIYTHFNESALQLFGFLSPHEKDLFKKLISVSGVGPKLGIAIVSALPYESVIQSIVQGDLATLTRISGVGKKTAERLVLDLRDKFKNMVFKAPISGLTRHHVGQNAREHDALQALVSLGYPEIVARQTLQSIEVVTEDTVQTLIKKSLGYLAS